MKFQFELGELGLPVNGGAHLVQQMADQISLEHLVVALFHQIMLQQYLVGGTGNLSHEYAVIGVVVRLGCVGVE